MRNRITFLFVFAFCALYACREQLADKKSDQHKTAAKNEKKEDAKKENPVSRTQSADDIKLKKELLYDKYTLGDTYPYKDTTRSFQWDKIKERLAFVENFLQNRSAYGVLQNYQNQNGEAPTVAHFVRDSYRRVADSFQVERYQAAPLYDESTDKLSRYGKDGWLVRVVGPDTTKKVTIQGVSFEGKYTVPRKYLRTIGDSVDFRVVNIVDVTNQNICTIERTDDGWVIRSMNPATTGRHKPPHAQETPTGLYVVQQHKSKMFYYKDGTKTYQGYAPYATRFTAGAYIHGVPTNDPKGSIIEYSQTLGTIPRSHMCVRNASSHAQFVYKRSQDYNSLVIVID